MMYYLPVMPYHQNLMDYWRANRDQHLGQDFWFWLTKQYKTCIVSSKQSEHWRFENKQDMIWFMLRWA